MQNKRLFKGFYFLSLPLSFYLSHLKPKYWIEWMKWNGMWQAVEWMLYEKFPQTNNSTSTKVICWHQRVLNSNAWCHFTKFHSCLTSFTNSSGFSIDEWQIQSEHTVLFSVLLNSGKTKLLRKNAACQRRVNSSLVLFLYTSKKNRKWNMY